MAERYRKPQTIDELKRFCEEKGMPLEKMRFFIGEDYPHPRAFGIYEAEDGDFVVYKNKADGTRAIRYKGPNEAYAVNELYEKLKAETDMRRNASEQHGTEGDKAFRNEIRDALFMGLPFGVAFMAIVGRVMWNGHGFDSPSMLLLVLGPWTSLIVASPVLMSLYRRKKERRRAAERSGVGGAGGGNDAAGSSSSYGRMLGKVLLLAFVIFILIGICSPKPSAGYYIYEKQTYYYYKGDWYKFGNCYDSDNHRITRGWKKVDKVDSELAKNYNDYYVSDAYSSDYGTSAFKDASSQTEHHDSHSGSSDGFAWNWSDSDSGGDSGSDRDSRDSGDIDWNSGG